MQITFLVLGWFIYFFLHSLLASKKAKQVAKGLMGATFKYYRLLYVLISVVGLLAILYLNANINSSDYFNSHGPIRYLSLMFAAFGVIVIKVSFRSYLFSSFIGITEENLNDLKITGLLGSIRHPIYSGTILIVIGYFLFSPNFPTLVSTICVFAYLPIGIYLEEKKLIGIFGDRYLKYRKEVPALFPRLF